MATPVIMPRQGQSVDSCVIGEWHKKKGDAVRVGDLLFTYETDKATFDEEARVEGTLLAVFFAEGDDVACLTNVCVIGDEGEDWSTFIPEDATTDGHTPSCDQTSSSTEKSPPTIVPTAIPAISTPQLFTTQQAYEVDIPDPAMQLGVATKVSPRAKRLAERAGTDIRFASPTGPDGRIIERDVRRLIEQGQTISPEASSYTPLTSEARIDSSVLPVDILPVSQHIDGVAPLPDTESTPDFIDKKLPLIRRVIAQRMHESLHSMAQLTHHSSFDATDIFRFRDRLKKAKSDDDNLFNFDLAGNIPTVTDIILFVVSRIAPKHPESNAHFLEDHIRYFNHVHVGCAVDTPRGLMVPVIRYADQLSLTELSKQRIKLAADARSGSINPDALTGGTFTVSNLGQFGIEQFTPIINPPETTILGICATTTNIREIHGQIVSYPSMGLSLTHDHRAYDGAPAARFLRDLVYALENFTLFLAGEKQI